MTPLPPPNALVVEVYVRLRCPWWSTGGAVPNSLPRVHIQRRQCYPYLLYHGFLPYDVFTALHFPENSFALNDMTQADRDRHRARWQTGIDMAMTGDATSSPNALVVEVYVRLDLPADYAK